MQVHPTLSALLVALGLVVVASPAQASSRVAPEVASQFIERMSAKTIRVAESAATSGELEARMRPLLEQGFGLDLISRFVLGRFSRRASSAELEEFHRLYPTYLLRTYASQLDRARGARVAVQEVRPVGESDQLVTTLLELPSGEPIQASWRVRNIAGAPRIIDVFFEGVSLAMTQREEFASVIKSQGLAGLLDALRRRTDTAEALHQPDEVPSDLGSMMRFLVQSAHASRGRFPAGL